jgi:hypothetical protein
VHFLAILAFDADFDLASEMDDKNSKAKAATVGCILLPGFLAGTDGARHFW